MINDELAISITLPHYLLCCSSCRHLLAQSQQEKQQNKLSDMFQVNSNWPTSTSRSSVFLDNTQQTPHLMLACLLLTLNMQLVCMVCETQNLLTSQYIVYSEIPFNRKLYHTEINQVICNPMQSNWMVLIDIRGSIGLRVYWTLLHKILNIIG